MPLLRIISGDSFFTGSGLLVTADGDGHRTTTQVAVAEGIAVQQRTSTGGALASDLVDLWSGSWEEGPATQKPVLLLADSMGRCIPVTDSVFHQRVQHEYAFDQMAEDVAKGVVALQHKNIIIWAGADGIASANTEAALEDLKALINIIRAKNKNIAVFVSTVLPQPKNQQHLQCKIAQFNDILKQAAAEFYHNGGRVELLQSHMLYLDESLDIVRPITDNFEDGFHLNIHGTHKLRAFWVRKLSLSK